MKIKYDAIRKRFRSQKGIAIVFVLGILGLLTVIGLGFASSALLDRKISNNVTNTESAKLLAKSGFERVLALLKVGALPDRIVSRNGTDGKDHDWLWKLNTAVDNIEIFALNGYDPAVKTMPVWQYIRKDPGNSNSEILGRIAYVVKSDAGKLDPSVHWGEYMGNLSSGVPGTVLPRFGTNEAEIQFKNALKTGSLSNTHLKNMTDFLYKSTAGTLVTPNTSSHFDSPSRWLDLVSLITTANGESGSVVSADGEEDLYKHLEFVQAPSPEAYWIDTDAAGDGVQTSEEFFHRFNLARIDWDNSYFDDVNIFFAMKKNGAAYEKLTNKDGGTYEYNARPYSEQLVKYEAGEVPAGTPADADMCLDTGGIHWLGKWEDNPASLPDAWTDALRRKQVAANIIQYCRKDTSFTVTDLSTDKKSDWVANNAEPLYAGNGKHPLINEVAVKASILGAVTETPVTDSPSTYDWNYNITFAFGAELIDIYNIAAKRNAEVYLIGKFSCKYFDLSSGGYKDWEHEFNKDNGKIEIKSTASPSPWGNNGYTTKDSFWHNAAVSAALPEGSFTGPAGAEAAHGDNLKIKDAKLVIEKVYLKYEDSAGTPVMRDRDFAKVGKTFNLENNAGSGSDIYISVKEQKYFYGAAATEDPRVNHYPDNWLPVYETASGSVAGANTDHEVTAVTGTADVFAGSSVKTTLGEKNLALALTAATTEDKEAADDPAMGKLSTAFIAEKPMLSLWELGAISRGEKWRTINLKRTAVYSGTKTNMSGGKNVVMSFGTTGYEAGDGNILDQVKINEIVAAPANDADKAKVEKVASYGKININSTMHNVLRAVFQGVKFNEEISKHYRYDRSSSDAGSDFYTLSCTGRNAADDADALQPDTCIACAIKAQENPAGTVLQFRSRADLLLPSHTKILDLFGVSGTGPGINDAEQEQVIGKTMNLLKAEVMDQAYVIVLAQTVKEAVTAHGKEMYIDWDRDGSIAGTAISIAGITDITTSNTPKSGTKEFAAKNAGYLRHPTITEWQNKRNLYAKSFGKETSLPEKVTKTAGTYCNGVDKITSTVKLVVLLERDSVSGTWKIVRYEYAD